MLTEAIVLSGGIGSRLKGVVNDRPKPMALINGKPFLEYLLNYLEKNDIQRVILSTGYKSEIISEYFGNRYHNLDIGYAIETEPLGTGGAIKLALNYTSTKEILILNGDTFFDIKIRDLYDFHCSKKAEISVALRRVNDGSRFGSVITDKAGRIKGFTEKNNDAVNVLINGGTYILNASSFIKDQFPEKFSFEKDYLEAKFESGNFFGKEFNNYFIDIGVPETYNQAQIDFKNIFAEM